MSRRDAKRRATQLVIAAGLIVASSIRIITYTIVQTEPLSDIEQLELIFWKVMLAIMTIATLWIGVRKILPSKKDQEKE